MVGSVAITIPAPINPQSVEYCPAKDIIPTGSVRYRSLSTNVFANISSFHVLRNVKIEAVASAGYGQCALIDPCVLTKAQDLTFTIFII